MRDIATRLVLVVNLCVNLRESLVMDGPENLLGYRGAWHPRNEGHYLITSC